MFRFGKPFLLEDYGPALIWEFGKALFALLAVADMHWNQITESSLGRIGARLAFLASSDVAAN